MFVGRTTVFSYQVDGRSRRYQMYLIQAKECGAKNSCVDNKNQRLSFPLGLRNATALGRDEPKARFEFRPGFAFTCQASPISHLPDRLQHVQAIPRQRHSFPRPHGVDDLERRCGAWRLRGLLLAPAQAEVNLEFLLCTPGYLGI